MRQTRPRAKPGQDAAAAPVDAPLQRSIAAATADGKALRAPAATSGRSALPRSRLKPAERLALFERLAADRPAPATELVYTNPFTLIVAVLLSAQATDVGVNKATARLFALADTPERMLALGEDRVRDAVRTIGLYRNKSKNVVELSRLLIERHGGQVPKERDALEALPGVGRKTANVVMNEAFGEPTIAVDTHIFRVANRTGLAPGKDPRQVEDLLERVVPVAYKRGAHHWLILHGRYVCKARKPECWRCVIADLCRFVPKTAAPAAAASLPQG
jgi:endonuclease-3